MGLTGRYIYLQLKVPVQSTPLAFHLDLKMVKPVTHNIRISASNLYKQVSTQNGFVMQLPLSLDINRWTVVVLDLYSLLKTSNLLPPTYAIEGSYEIQTITLCANSIMRGVYTSDNQYDFVTLPMDLRFKFSFDISRWPEHFAWLELPNDLNEGSSERALQNERSNQTRARQALLSHNRDQQLATDQERA